MSDHDLTPVWKALADPNRRKILDLLKVRPRTTGDLCAAFEFSRFAVMKHLKILEDAELVIVKREGRVRWNHLNAIPIQQVYERWVRDYEGQWATSLLGLKWLAEQKKGEIDAMMDDAVSRLHKVDIKQVITIQAPPTVVFDALVQEIGQWWQAPFFQGDHQTTKMVLTPNLGGSLYEDWGNGEGVLLATVVSIKRPTTLRLSGTFGMGGPVSGEILFQLEAKAEATLLHFSHQAIGVLDDQAEANFNGGWATLLGTYLREFIEKKIDEPL